MRRIIFLALTLIFAGCSALSHLDQLLTLQSYSKNKELQHRYIINQDKKFTALLAAVKDKSVEKYRTKRQIVKKFGDPVFCRETGQDNQGQEICLHRYAMKFVGSQKVYFYFDAKGNLQKWEYVAPPTKEQMKGPEEKSGKS